MTEFNPPLDDVRFMMNEVFDMPSLWQRLPAYSDVIEIDTANAILDEAAKLMSEVIHPTNQVGDEQGCQWSDGIVKTPEGFKDAYQAFVDGGWNGLVGEAEYGGMGMPKTLACYIDEMLQSANISFGLAPMLTAGACLAIKTHGSSALKETYLPKMYEGIWSGSMDLTEPHAGSDLGLIRTKAVAHNDGSYRISGTKIFITWGEHDLTENIIHLVLAKLPGAPEGSKGISMFLVPKWLLNSDGSLGDRNRVHCGSIEHKMGIHGSATCVMNYDQATGWLVGEAHKGLAAMFTMMNDERLAVGIQGLGVSELAYQQACHYARERRQGRNPAGAEDADQEADSLLVHADVRRMLLTIRCFNEGARAFISYLARWADIEKQSEDLEERQKAKAIIALLTPVAKAFITDTSFENTVLAQQVLGGHGYIREWGVEQLVRDIRITQIYEGTNGIQAMDLAGRKTIAVDGALLDTFIQDIKCFIAGNDQAELVPYINELTRLVATTKSITAEVIAKAESDPHIAGAVAHHYLHLLGYLAYLFMWSKMIAATVGKQSPFYERKQKLGQFFLANLLPKTDSLIQSIRAGSEPLMTFGPGDF